MSVNRKSGAPSRTGRGANCLAFLVLALAGFGLLLPLGAQQNPGPTASPVALPQNNVPAASPQAGQDGARIFAANLWNQSLDLRLGKDGIFQTLGLKPLGVSQMVVFDSLVNRELMYRISGTDAWQSNTEADGKTSLYRLSPGAVYLFLVHSDGKAGLYQLGVPKGNGPRMAVLNASGKNLSLVQVGISFNQGTVAQSGRLLPGWTDFLEIPEGSFAGFWAYEEMPRQVSHFYTSGSDGLSLGMYPLRKNSWYLFLIWDDPAAQGSGGIIWDISPSP